MARAIVLNLRDGGSKSRGLMESQLITRGMASSLWLTGGRTGTLAFEPLIMGYVVSYLLTASYICCGVSSLSVSSSFQSLPKLLTEVPTLIKKYGSLLRLLAEILYSISLLPEGEGPTIVFPQHLEESS